MKITRTSLENQKNMQAFIGNQHKIKSVRIDRKLLEHKKNVTAFI